MAAEEQEEPPDARPRHLSGAVSSHAPPLRADVGVEASGDTAAAATRAARRSHGDAHGEGLHALVRQRFTQHVLAQVELLNVVRGATTTRVWPQQVPLTRAPQKCGVARQWLISALCPARDRAVVRRVLRPVRPAAPTGVPLWCAARAAPRRLVFILIPRRFP
jgi:hypothetical protein